MQAIAIEAMQRIGIAGEEEGEGDREQAGAEIDGPDLARTTIGKSWREQRKK